MKIAVVPIDNRPICYDLIKDVLAIDKNIELFIPDIQYLGGLTTQSNVEKIFEFLTNLPKIDYIVVALDTIAYGGLVSSRRCQDGFDLIKQRIENFVKIVKQKECKVLAFSSVMRISNNNINEEEKEYWAQYGKRIFDWSYYLHKSEVELTYNCVHNFVPKEILDDYLNTRKRNFDVNKLYLKFAQDEFFDTLIFSKDDCAEFGLNVKEANELQKIIDENNIKNVKIKTGADEMPLSLISRALNEKNQIKIEPIFIEDKSIDLISKYEDVSIKNCVLGQLELAKCELNFNQPDLKLLINNFKSEQGDLVLGNVVNKLDTVVDFNIGKFIIADVNNANGADVNLIEQILKTDLNNFYGYCAYNTSANTLGCAIFVALTKIISIKNNSYNEEAFKKIQFIRFLDDWVYQGISRKYIRESGKDFNIALAEKEDELNSYAKIISKFLKFYPKEIKYSLPWNRSFEIRIMLR